MYLYCWACVIRSIICLVLSVSFNPSRKLVISKKMILHCKEDNCFIALWLLSSCRVPYVVKYHNIATDHGRRPTASSTISVLPSLVRKKSRIKQQRPSYREQKCCRRCSGHAGKTLEMPPAFSTGSANSWAPPRVLTLLS